jgi:hypothetical protein
MYRATFTKIPAEFNLMVGGNLMEQVGQPCSELISWHASGHPLALVA